MTEIWKWVAIILPEIVIAIAIFYIKRQITKRDKRMEERDAAREERESLRLDLEIATAELSYATAMAIKRGTPNGEMEKGIAKYDAVMDKFEQFEHKQTIKL